VVLLAVGLDHDALLAPEEVRANGRSTVRQREPLLDLGLRQAERAAEREKPLLELAFGRRRPDVMLLEHPHHLPGRGPRRIAGELVLDRAEIEHFEDLSLVEGTLEAATVDDIGEVQERAGDGRAGDVVRDGAVVSNERPRAMEVNARMSPARAARNGDFDVRAVATQEPVQGGGLAMAQHRAWASGEHRRHPPALAREQPGRDEGIHAAIDAMEASASGALVHRRT
jgi:hypothetical protein